MKKILFACAALSLLVGCVSTPDDGHAEIHQAHDHTHGEGCGHVMVQHGDHWDYLHEGHLHHVHDGHVDEHFIAVSATNPDGENPLPAETHAGHMHGTDGETHLMVRHGDHMDFIHDGRLHHAHGDHVDDHGPVTVKQKS